MNSPVSIEPQTDHPALPSAPARGRTVLAAAGVLVVAALLAGCVQLLQAGRNPERGVLLTAAVFGLILAAIPALYLLRERRAADAGTLGLLTATGCAVLLLAGYLFSISGYVFFPADFLIWSESDFVNDILKFSLGHPLYTPQVNSDSFVYSPGSQLLTYLLAWVAGQGISIQAFRVIQLAYTAAAAFMATLCCRRILRMAFPDLDAGRSWLWNSFWYATLLLVATNSITNPFIHNLHGDALAQLATLTAYYFLLQYAETRSRAALAGMALMVPAGFLVKQSLVAWAGWYGVFLVIWDRAWKRILAFAAAAGILITATLGVCYAIWGAPFFYWTFYVMGHHPISPLRSFQHMLSAWPYFAAGLLGGAAVLLGRNRQVLLGAWLVGLAVIASETYTSGIAWMLNHIGPGSLIAAVWFLAGLASVWKPATAQRGWDTAGQWIRSGALTAAVLLFFSGLGLVRIPVRAIPDDAYRYVRDIEREFKGLPAKQVLLDAGSWTYLKDRVIVGDRAPAIGELGGTGTGDFSGTIARISAKRYSRILVRGLHAPDFVYDYFLWSKPSGIRQALLDHYREVRTIRGVEANSFARNWAEDPYYFGEITVLEPKAGSF
jgi:hypothetical protein